MDTENFIVKRAELVSELQRRRSMDLDAYPFRMVRDYGIKLPTWARLALSFVTRGGALSRMMELGIPLAFPFLFRKQMPFMERLVYRIFSHKS